MKLIELQKALKRIELKISKDTRHTIQVRIQVVKDVPIMLAYKPQSGTTSMLIEYNPVGRNARLSGLSIDKRNDASVMRRTKTSIILHFPRISSHCSMLPRRVNDIHLGGTTQRKRLISCFE